MARVLRGEVRWADLGISRGHERSGQRPVLVLSADIFNERSGTAIVVALTSRPQRAGFPLTLRMESITMSKPSWVKISQVRTVSVERLGESLGVVSHEAMTAVIEGLNEILGA